MQSQVSILTDEAVVGRVYKSGSVTKIYGARVDENDSVTLGNGIFTEEFGTVKSTKTGTELFAGFGCYTSPAYNEALNSGNSNVVSSSNTVGVLTIGSIWVTLSAGTMGQSVYQAENGSGLTASSSAVAGSVLCESGGSIWKVVRRNATTNVALISNVLL